MSYLKSVVEHVLFYPYYRKVVNGSRFKCIHRYESIFFHIPKVAGTSINQELYGSKGLGHVNAEYLLKVLGPIDFRRYFKFTFVRCPYSRLYSAYRFLSQGGMNSSDQRYFNNYIDKYGDFENFVLKYFSENGKHHYVHFKTQSSFVTIDGVPSVDYVGYMENYEKDLRYIFGIIGVDFKNVTLNVSGDNINIDNIYSSRMKEVVLNVYRDDFENFYEF